MTRSVGRSVVGRSVVGRSFVGRSVVGGRVLRRHGTSRAPGVCSAHHDGELPDRRLHLRVERSVQDEQGAPVLHRPGRADHRRAAGLAPGAGAEIDRGRRGPAAPAARPPGPRAQPCRGRRGARRPRAQRGARSPPPASRRRARARGATAPPCPPAGARRWRTGGRGAPPAGGRPVRFPRRWNCGRAK